MNRAVAGGTSFPVSKPPVRSINRTEPGLGPAIAPVTLIALTSWTFTCEGPGTFRELMLNLNDAMFGTVADPGHPALADTGHLQINVQDRLGASEAVWYRGPLVPFELTRDPLGPYHSADQARRVTVETGAEDVSYAAAFELGRLLAASDPRFAKSIMQWRRESYKQSARASTIGSIANRMSLNLPSTLAEQLHTPVAPRAAAQAAQLISNSGLPAGDPYGLTRIAGAPGLNAANLQAAWQLPSLAAAAALLNDPGSLGAVVSPPESTSRPDATLEQAASDGVGLTRLASVRTQAINDALTTLEGQ
jgi:hypothetical protein